MDKFTGLWKGKKGREEVKDSDMVWESIQNIARESFELAYSRNCEQVGYLEIINDRNSVE